MKAPVPPAGWIVDEDNWFVRELKPHDPEVPKEWCSFMFQEGELVYSNNADYCLKYDLLPKLEPDRPAEEPNSPSGELKQTPCEHEWVEEGGEPPFDHCPRCGERRY